MRDDMNITGRLTIYKYTLDGQLVEQRQSHNDITLAGRDLVARLFNTKLANEPIARVSQMRVGSSADDFNPKHAGLVQPIGDAIALGAIEDFTTSDAQGRLRKMLRIAVELNESQGNGDLREAGLFTSDDVMYNRVVFDTISKTNMFRLSLFWEIIF